MPPKKYKAKAAKSSSEEEEDEERLELQNSKEILTAISDLKKSIEFMSRQFDEIKKQNAETQNILKTLQKENNQLRKENENLKGKINYLEECFNEIQQKDLKNNVVLVGIPNQANENTAEIVLKVAKSLNCTMKKEDIEDCYRKSKKNDAPIVVKFKRNTEKTELVKKRKEKGSITVQECSLQGNNNNIYINDHLTQYYNNLFFEARQLKKRGFKYIWIKDGKVLVRKTDNDSTIIIKTVKDIEKMN